MFIMFIVYLSINVQDWDSIICRGWCSLVITWPCLKSRKQHTQVIQCYVVGQWMVHWYLFHASHKKLLQEIDQRAYNFLLCMIWTRKNKLKERDQGTYNFLLCIWTNKNRKKSYKYHSKIMNVHCASCTWVSLKCNRNMKITTLVSVKNNKINVTFQMSRLIQCLKCSWLLEYYAIDNWHLWKGHRN